MKITQVTGRLFAVLILLVAFAGIAYSGEPTDVWVGQVNINDASAEELQEIPGLNKDLSRNIVDFREANGPFSSTNDLKLVNGIDEEKLTEIKQYVRLDGDSTLEHVYP
ncbi:MAG TPA: helix-hairpin-helix domain-containing protein [Deltaproteobacteria bacterium]|nr:helix-hairpin-helix domain-containing protein [Deltaproteobacteria bacterium]HPR52412.1 helix-hairpin-helix domain-containing protein [Deltaproteobacteria bacterium]